MRSLVYLPYLLAPTVVFVAPASADDFLSVSEAQKVLFPKADVFSEGSIELSKDQMAKIKDLSGVRQRKKMQSVWVAKKLGATQGWVLVDDVIGKHELITFALGIDLEGKVAGVEILSYRETHGGEVREALWRKNFQGKSVASPLKLEVDIPNISGATLSSRNVTDGVKRLLTIHQLHLQPTAVK